MPNPANAKLKDRVRKYVSRQNSFGGFNLTQVLRVAVRGPGVSEAKEVRKQLLDYCGNAIDDPVMDVIQKEIGKCSRKASQEVEHITSGLTRVKRKQSSKAAVASMNAESQRTPDQMNSGIRSALDDLRKTLRDSGVLS